MKLIKLILIICIFSIANNYSFSQIGYKSRYRKAKTNTSASPKQTGFAKVPDYGLFYIQSALEYNKSKKGYWDIPGGKNPIIKNGKNIELWEKNGGEDQKFRFIKSNTKGYFEICVSYNKSFRANVDGGKTKNGTNLELWSNNNNNRQLFKFQHLGFGKFKIMDKNGKVITIKGRNSKNGNNIHIWDNNSGKWNEWYIINAKTGKKFVPNKFYPFYI